MTNNTDKEFDSIVTVAYGILEKDLNRVVEDIHNLKTLLGCNGKSVTNTNLIVIEGMIGRYLTGC